MDGTQQDTVSHPTIISRLIAVCALGFIALFFLNAAGAKVHSNPTNQDALAWAAQHQQQIWIGGFANGLSSTFSGLLVLLLVPLVRGRGLLATLVSVGVAVALAVQWVHAAVFFALAELAHRGGADAGVLALFTLGETMDSADGVALGMALACLSVLLLRSRTLPAALGWFGLVVAAVGALSTPIHIAGGAFIDPVTVVLGFLWCLAVSAVLLIKPVRLRGTADIAAPAGV
jgi:hypothetical protein